MARLGDIAQQSGLDLLAHMDAQIAPFLQRALMFLDKTFQALVDFSRDGYLKSDF